MEWIKFTVDSCPKGESILFLQAERGVWFEGELHYDQEYDCYLIDLWESSTSIDGVTHYLKPETWAK